MDVPFSKKKETKQLEMPKKAEIQKSKKLDIETRKKIVGDGVKEILEMDDEELVSRYGGKSEDEICRMLRENPCFDSSLIDEAMLEFLSVLTCMSINFEDAFIDWLAHFIFRRLLDIHNKVGVEPPKVQSPKIRSEYVSHTNQGFASVAVEHEKTSSGKGGIVFLIIIGLLFGYGYMSLKKEEAEWDMAQEQYRIESRRKAEQNEFRAREEKRKKKRSKVQVHHHLLRLHPMMKVVMMRILVIMMRIVTIMMKAIVMV